MASVHRKGRGFVEKKPEELKGIFNSPSDEATATAKVSKIESPKTESAAKRRRSSSPVAAVDGEGTIGRPAGGRDGRDGQDRRGEGRRGEEWRGEERRGENSKKPDRYARSESRERRYRRSRSPSDRSRSRSRSRRGARSPSRSRERYRSRSRSGGRSRLADNSSYRNRRDGAGDINNNSSAYRGRRDETAGRPGQVRGGAGALSGGNSYGPRGTAPNTTTTTATTTTVNAHDSASNAAVSAAVASKPTSIEELVRKHRAAMLSHALRADTTSNNSNNNSASRQVTLLYAIPVAGHELDAVKTEVRAAVEAALSGMIIRTAVPSEYAQLYDHLITHSVFDISAFPFPGGVEALIELHHAHHACLVAQAVQHGGLVLRGTAPQLRAGSKDVVPPASAVEEFFPYLIANEEAAAAAAAVSSTADAAAKKKHDETPSIAVQRSFFPQLGSAIAVSNTKKNAAIIASGSHATSGAVTNDLLAQLRARVTSASLGLSSGGTESHPDESERSYGDSRNSSGVDGRNRSESRDRKYEDAAKSSSAPSSSSSQSTMPLLGMQSSTVTLPFPNGMTGMVSIGPLPAITAGLVGSGGVMNLMASVTTSPILVIMNALTDSDLRNPVELADIIADIAIECQKAVGSKGKVLAVRVPKPQRADETIDIVFTRPIKLRPDGMSIGGIALLEDNRSKDRSQAIPTTANSFFAKALGKGGANMGAPGGIGSVDVAGLLTNGSASSFGAAGATYSSFYAESGAPTGTRESEAPAAQHPSDEADEGDDGSGYDPLAGRTRGLGKVFVEFDNKDAAVMCQNELSGRAFGGRILVTSFANEAAYNSGQVCDFKAC